ncbi:hypothetical protein PV327_005831 [Microctonus hyperodae]|uniref:Potassium channel voltage dependent KCNQ C-terminal domain-containing protein n=1 Tax=Microctonus hyperodae TaxID=165561 RepID=A0AA39L084_MICHY|nr:hypothetical protein PV327_005831 [Microctonus hyperodae]
MPLDQILGKQGSKARDAYVSKISLASRVVKVERQVDDIETKLDQLIELYMEDRKRILSLPLTKIDSHHVPQSPLVTSQEIGVLKPILIDKQLSEPSSPTSKTTTRDGKQHQKPRQIHRGYSDLGTRVKKRVTLSIKNSSIASHLVHLDEASSRPIIPSTTQYTTTTSLSQSRDDGVVIIVPTLPDITTHPTSSTHQSSTLNGNFVTIERNPDRSTGSENETEDTSCERVALLSPSGSTKTNLPDSIDPGGNVDQ